MLILCSLYKTSFGATPEGGPRFNMVLLKLIHLLSREAGFPFPDPCPSRGPVGGALSSLAAPKGSLCPRSGLSFSEPARRLTRATLGPP